MQALANLKNRARFLWRHFQEKSIIVRGLDKLESGLSRKAYPYHNVGHARDVAVESLTLALHDGTLKFHEIELLVIAAVYHDSGYLVRYEANEVFGAQAAAQAMSLAGGYNMSDVTRVCDAILATEVKPRTGGGLIQSVKSRDLLSEYLADADLGNFGRPDFFASSESIFQELVIHGKISSDTQEFRDRFRQFTIALLAHHTYYTPAGRALRESGKYANLQALKGGAYAVQK